MSFSAHDICGQYMKKTVSGSDVIAATDCVKCVLPELIIFGSTDGTGEPAENGGYEVRVEVSGTVYRAFIDAPLRKLGDAADCLIWSRNEVIRKTGADGVLFVPVVQTAVCESIIQQDGLNTVACTNVNNPSAITAEFFVYAYSDAVEHGAGVYGLEVDYEHETFVRLADAYGKSAGADFDQFPPMGGRRRCNLADDGTVNAWYGDGAYRDDGTNGQVMVYQPCFYYRTVPELLAANTVSNKGYHIKKAAYYISAVPRNGFKLHPAFYDKNGEPTDHIFYSAYEGSLYDMSLDRYFNDGTDSDTSLNMNTMRICSVADKKPISGLYKNLTRDNFERLAAKRGDGWHCETVKTLSAVQMLFMIEYGTMNSQSAIGSGIVNIVDAGAYNCSSITGSTAFLGNSSGTAMQTVNEKNGRTTVETAEDRLAVSYRGMENPWGNYYKHIVGLNVWNDGSMAGGQPYICRDLNFADSKRSGNYFPAGFTLAEDRGYIKLMGYSDGETDWLFFPSAIGGSASGAVGDDAYHKFANQAVNKYYNTQFGGFWIRQNMAGIFNIVNVNVINSKSRNTGGRLVFIPTVHGD